MISKLNKEGFTTKACKQFYFAHVLETLRNLRDKYFETTGLDRLKGCIRYNRFARADETAFENLLTRS